MATVSNPIRFGSNTALASPSYDDLYLPIFGGEVLTRYNEHILATRFVKRQSIMSGNTARFPRLGGIGAERHGVGTKLLGLDAEQTEVTITLDERPLVSHFRLDDIDRAMAHFEVRSEMAMQAGQALAEAQDRYTYRLLINASRETPTTVYGGGSSNFPGGGIDGAGTAEVVSGLTAPGTAWDETDVGLFLTGLDNIVQRWDEIRVPFANRHVVIDVAAWHAMKNWGSPRTPTDLNNARTPFFQANDGTYGNQANPGQFIPQMVDFNTPLQYNGLMIWRSNLLPNGNDLSNDDEAKYQGDFTLTRGIAFQMDAVAVATLMDIQTEAGRMIEHQDWLFVTKMLSGGGTLRPEAAVEIITD
jgi:hypothetical protein